MSKTFCRGIFVTAFAVLCLGVAASSAVAQYEFNQPLSLRGDCTVSNPDFIPDPGCPGGAHPPKGRFSEPRSIAIDSYGNEYVASTAARGPNGRIDVFDEEGNFITELLNPNGPQSVAVDTQGNLYVFEQVSGGNAKIVRYAPTGTYDPAGGEIEYGSPGTVIAEDENTIVGGVTVDTATDRVFVTFASSFVEVYSPAAAGNDLLTTITRSEPPLLSWSNWAAVDAERRRLYVSSCQDGTKDCGILVFEADAPYALLKEIDGSGVPAGKFGSQKGWLSIAVDEDTGHFFIDDLETTKNIYEFDENYGYFATTTFPNFQGGNSLQIALSNSKLNPAAKNRRHLFVPVPVGSGSAFAFSPPKEVAPKVESVEATNIAEREAELRATIHPGGGVTGYSFEYVTQAAFDETEWASAQTGGAGTLSAGNAPREVVAVIDGLEPATDYRFRVIATNGKGSDEGEGSFRTYPSLPVASNCPNQIFRIGFSLSLPDCRAYELVTPADTNGRPPKGERFNAGDHFHSPQASPSGNAVSFTTEGGSIPGTEGAGGFDGDPYRSFRTASGWGFVRMGPSGAQTTIPSPGSPSPDQGHLFWTAGGEGSAYLNDQTTHYIRYPDGHDELVGQGTLGIDPTAIGRLITEGATYVVFQTRNESPAVAQQLEPNAPPSGTAAVYDRTADGVTHVVSLLPGDETPAPGENAQYLDASADGAGIAFSINGTLYLRVDNAVTYEIAENADLADVSEGGSRIFYVQAGDLFAFDVASEEEIRFTETGDLSESGKGAVVNVAPDGSRAYFVSTQVIPSSGENPNGDAAQPGLQNLYLSEEGAIRFVGTVTSRDVEGRMSGLGTMVDGLGLWMEYQRAEAARDPSRVDADGSVLLFQSRANLDGYAHDGVPQVYRYDSVSERLHCVSCLPTRGPAAGGASLETVFAHEGSAPPLSTYGFVPNLRFDGQRAFFQSMEPLVPSDSDGLQDVYEWEEQGVGSCNQPGGCVYLISSGQSASDDYLYGVSRSGDDVFFTTQDVLVGADYGATSIYDARVGGGFAEAPKDICEGEECRPSPAPDFPPPARPTPGDDNVKPRKHRPCAKGKRKVKRAGKVRCVKKKSPKKQRRKAAAKRGAAR